MKRSIIISLIAFAVCFVQAQDTIRIAYIDKQAVIQMMPEKADIDTKLSGMTAQFESEYQRMTNEYNLKVRDYLKENKELSEPIRLARQAEITESEERAAIYKLRYTTELEKQRSTLWAPVMERMQEAIKSVAQENNITVVLDHGTPVYLAPSCMDITQLVIDKLTN